MSHAEVGQVGCLLQAQEAADSELQEDADSELQEDADSELELELELQDKGPELTMA
jgi:hypothetical protein